MFCDMIRILCLAHLWILLTLTISLAEPQTLISEPSASEFNRLTLVQPVVQHARTKRHISTTRDTDGSHHLEVTMRIAIDGKEFILDLKLNQDLVTDNHTLTYQENGKTVRRKLDKEEIDLCQYGGTVRDKPGSWVALSTCHGVEGIVFDGKRMRYIEPANGGDITSQHYVYDHSDLTVLNKCGYDGKARNDSRHYHKELHRDRTSRYKRHASVPQVRVPYNANKMSRYVELVLVADHRVFVDSGRNHMKVYHRMKTLANIINSVYSPLNIFVALVSVEVWTQHDEITVSRDSGTTLDNFLEYRNNVLLKLVPNDNAHLISGMKFDYGIIGKAYMGSICTSKASGGVSYQHTNRIGLQAMTIAHELGHNLGMDHDDESCECSGEKCIMSAQGTNVTPTHWSTCSLNSLALTYWKELDNCLRNKPQRLFYSPTCGNGFVEPGEQCDCGMTSVAQPHKLCHSCCDPNTCRLRANATCGTGECCDLQTCHQKSAGTVCRSADRECDLPEYCTGHSEFCPDDVYKMDITPCGKDNVKAYCVRGQCNSHSDQCRLLWGITAKASPDICYRQNLKGDRDNNCGYDSFLNRYIKCAERDAMCGRLQCSRLDKKLDIGYSRASRTNKNYITKANTIIQCHTAAIDLGENDPGMVPDGAICGHEMMCLNHSCVSVRYVREMIAIAEGSVCPSNCSGHGVCNSAGQCHCEPGFAPPLCATPGPGGSYSSGPATDPTIRSNLKTPLYLILLGVMPAILLILFFVFYFSPSIRQRCTSSVYLDKNKPTQNSPVNIDSQENYKQTPKHIDNSHDDKTIYSAPNCNIKTNVGNKSNSVIYNNIEFLKKFMNVGNSPKYNVDNSPVSPIYANFGLSKIQTSNNLANSNLPTREQNR